MKWFMVLAGLLVLGCGNRQNHTEGQGAGNIESGSVIAPPSESTSPLELDGLTSPQPDRIATSLRMKPVYPHAIRTLTYHPTGTLLAAGDGTGQVVIINPADGMIEHKFTAHAHWTFDIDFSDDGKLLATGGGDQVIQVFDTSTWKSLRTIDAHSDDLHGVAISPDGKQIYSGGDDSAVLRHPLAAGLSVVVGTHAAQVTSVALSPDGKLLASSGRDETVNLWDPVTKAQLAAMTGHTEDVLQVNFSSDGRFLISASYDKTARVWEVATSRLVTTLTGHGDWVFSAAFAEQDRILVTASGDSYIRTFDLQGIQIDKMYLGADIADVAVAPDGNHLAAATAAGTISVLKLSKGKLFNERVISLLPEQPGPEAPTPISTSEYLRLHELLLAAAAMSPEEAQQLGNDWSVDVALLSQHGDQFTLSLLESFPLDLLPATKQELVTRIRDKLAAEFPLQVPLNVEQLRLGLQRTALADLSEHALAVQLKAWIGPQLALARNSGDTGVQAAIDSWITGFVPTETGAYSTANVQTQVGQYLREIQGQTTNEVEARQ